MRFVLGQVWVALGTALFLKEKNSMSGAVTIEQRRAAKFVLFSKWKEGKCFTVNVGVVLAITFCRNDANTKEVGIKHVFSNGWDTYSMVGLPKAG